MKHDKGDLIHVVFSAFQRVYKLPDNYDRGIAGVVMGVFESLVDDVAGAVGEQLHFIAVLLIEGREVGHVGTELGVSAGGVGFFCRRGFPADVGDSLVVTSAWRE